MSRRNLGGVAFRSHFHLDRLAPHQRVVELDVAC